MRALVIGTGAIGMRHIRNLRAIYPTTEFVLLRRAGSVALPSEIEDAHTVEDLDAAIQSAPDCAIVASPSAVHIDVLPKLIMAGIPCYVEKPVVTRQEDAEEIRRALAQGPNRQHAAGFNLRLLPSLVAAKNAVKSGSLGRVVRASFAVGQWLPQWRPNVDHRRSYSGSVALGGGVIFDLCHELDSARSLLGECTVIASIAARVPELEIESEGVACILTRSANGAAASISMDYVARKRARRYELIGTTATLVWDLAEYKLVLSSSDGDTSLASGPEAFDVAATYVAAMREFLNGALHEAPLENLPGLTDGLRSSEMAIAAHSIGSTD